MYCQQVWQQCSTIKIHHCKVCIYSNHIVQKQETCKKYHSQRQLCLGFRIHFGKNPYEHSKSYHVSSRDNCTCSHKRFHLKGLGSALLIYFFPICLQFHQRLGCLPQEM